MPETRACDYCGDDVTRPPSRFTGEHAFCKGSDCRAKWQEKKVSLDCDNCGESFERVPSQVTEFDTHFCEKECMYEYQRGENAPNWRGGHDNWTTSPEAREWRESVFARDSYECQDCGRCECRLNAHHVLRRSENPEKALDVDTGVSLCLYCHARRHFEAGEMGAYRLIKGNLRRLDNV